MPVDDAERVDEVVQLAHEEIDRPEVGAPVGAMRAAAVAELVVVDDRPAVTRQIGQGQQVVVRGAGAAVKDDERRRALSSPEGFP